MLQAICGVFSSPNRRAPTPPQSPSPPANPCSTLEQEDETQDLLDRQLAASPALAADGDVLTLPTGEVIPFTSIFEYFAANPNLSKHERVEMMEIAKVQTAQSGRAMDGFAARIEAYYKKEELYKCLNMTKEDADAKHPDFVVMAGRGVRSTKDLELATKRLESLKDPRSRAVAETAKNNARWKDSVTGTKTFARFLNSAANGLDACCALNTVIIERLERVDQGQHGGVRFPGATTVDFKRALVLLRKSPVPRPSCKLSLLRKYGMHVLPSGLCDEWKASAPHSSTSSWFPGEAKRDDGQYTVKVIDDVPKHDRETRATAATPLCQAYEIPIEIPDSDDDEKSAATPSNKRKPAGHVKEKELVIKKEPGLRQAKKAKKT
ncbi:hypothetical protein BofuT4_P074500.1 [Botrytis cinerea T4]|uniref:Uncharacterized protein n=1 Tax=Botryotinia fuckeliana (strain T4) TaxID=999810 RepID=G2XP42_BOTF4|nr:hypothetical protein BofuT4_P074500.1 [Botrytis cinerea T4]